MQRTENQETKSPEKSTEFVHLPKEVHKEAVIQLFGYATIDCRLRSFVGADLFCNTMGSPVTTALALMGYGEYRVSDQFMDNVFDIVNYYTGKMSEDLISANTERLGKKIYKAVKLEIAKYNRKSVCHE